MYTIYEDDYATSPDLRNDSDGAIELYWNHSSFPNQWSGRRCDSYPYEDWSEVTANLHPYYFGAWSPYTIILAHFGLLDTGKLGNIYGIETLFILLRQLNIPWEELRTLGPTSLELIKNRIKDGSVYSNLLFEKSSVIFVPHFEELNKEALEYFSKHPDALTQLSWRGFEKLLEAIFRNQGFITELGPGSGDGGVDLRLIQKDSVSQFITLVQAKKWDRNNPIDLSMVAALYGVVESQGANRGLFVTTSRYLPSARTFANNISHRLVLACSEEVAQWCELAVKGTQIK